MRSSLLMFCFLPASILCDKCWRPYDREVCSCLDPVVCQSRGGQHIEGGPVRWPCGKSVDSTATWGCFMKPTSVSPPPTTLGAIGQPCLVPYYKEECTCLDPAACQSRSGTVLEGGSSSWPPCSTDETNVSGCWIPPASTDGPAPSTKPGPPNPTAPITEPPIANSGPSSVVATATPTQTAEQGTTTRSERIALGVGLGVGIPAIIVALLAWLVPAYLARGAARARAASPAPSASKGPTNQSIQVEEPTTP
jgi:hypothetical protein